MNSVIKIIAYQGKVGNETEHIFGDDFNDMDLEATNIFESLSKPPN